MAVPLYNFGMTGDEFELALRRVITMYSQLGPTKNYGVPSWKPDDLTL